MDWFIVDKVGLAKLLEKKGKAFAVFELISNCLDTNATYIAVTISPVAGKPYAEIIVEDDDPRGFSKLEHAFTLFAESEKKSDAEKRGRFNLGEKLVLALCSEASIISTTGSVIFDASGRHTSKRKTERGSVFRGLIRMTRDEYTDVLAKLDTLLIPSGVKLTINGQPMASRNSIAGFECTLPTEKSNDEGYLRPTARKTLVTLHEVKPGETATLYELGIPVVETGDKWHVNVHQKVPLNVDRDNVTPAYLREVRAYVLNETFAMLKGEEDATASWVRDASGDKRVAPEALTHVMTERFGNKRVSFDPSDLEGSKLAVSEGYTVIPGGALSAGEWRNVRATGAVLPAGKVTPSPKPFSPDGSPLKMLPREKWTAGMKDVAAFAAAIGKLVVGEIVTIDIANDTGWPFSACFGQRCITFNAGRLGHRWFDQGRKHPDVLRLIIHELAHHYASDHLSREYHDALCKVGARVVIAAIEQPTLFESNPTATLPPEPTFSGASC